MKKKSMGAVLLKDYIGLIKSGTRDAFEVMRRTGLNDIMDCEDLFHDGIVAFLEAFPKYDKERAKLSTFMYWRLKGAFTKVRSKRFYQKKYETYLEDFKGGNL